MLHSRGGLLIEGEEKKMLDKNGLDWGDFLIYSSYPYNGL